MREPFWEDRKVVVTGGGTREAIDGVRYLSNRSSGKMGNALATALWLRGADVCYVTTMPHGDLPAEVYTVEVESAKEMLDYTADCLRVARKGKMTSPSMNRSEPVSLVKKTPYLFMAAAVSDYTPRYPQEDKLKKSALGESWSLELVRTDDILSTIDKEGIVTVAFKAETDPEEGPANARRLLDDKGVDAVCYNRVSSTEGFGTDDNEVLFITADGESLLSRGPKAQIALGILDNARELSDEP
jgi:phosphopantothenoylcysteine decarboxylase/phosphopantothenate--cysteine ligase